MMCGVWSMRGGRTVVMPCHVYNDGGMRRVYFCGESYCREKKEGSDRTYEVFDPQPQPGKIVTVVHYYATHQLDAT